MMNIFNNISVYLLFMQSGFFLLVSINSCFIWFEIKFLAFLEEQECCSDMDKIDVSWHDYCVLLYSQMSSDVSEDGGSMCPQNR